MVIPKSEGEFQIVYDASNRTNRIVVEKDGTHTWFENGQWHVKLDLPKTVTPDHPSNQTMNMLQCATAFYMACTVEFTRLFALKQYLRKWKHARINIIDLSAAYNHGKCNPLFSVLTSGIQAFGLFFRILCFSFGSCRSPATVEDCAEPVCRDFIFSWYLVCIFPLQGEGGTGTQ